MKKLNSAKSIIKLIVCLVLCAAFYFIGKGAGAFESFKSAFSGFSFDLKTLLRIVIAVVMVLAVENLLLLILSFIKSKKPRTLTLISIIGNALRYVAAIAIICWVLTILGADIGTIVAGVGIIALVIGFGAESLIADLVTGIFMIFENQYNVGDYIEVDGFRGRVTSMGIRSTCITDAGGNVKIVNNSAMGNILNRSDNTSRAVSTIAIPYATDIEALEVRLPEITKDIFERHTDIFISEPVYLGVEELADSAIVLKFIAEVDDQDIYSGSRMLNRELLLGLRSIGIECPFPQVDVHQK